jgi:hypothetical protein
LGAAAEAVIAAPLRRRSRASTKAAARLDRRGGGMTKRAHRAMKGGFQSIGAAPY